MKNENEFINSSKAISILNSFVKIFHILSDWNKLEFENILHFLWVENAGLWNLHQYFYPYVNAMTCQILKWNVWFKLWYI